MELKELRPGLWRWTAPHPDWEPPNETDDPADWAPDVGSVAYEAAAGLVLIDPLVVDGDYSALDELAGSSPNATILTTLPFHKRSRDELEQRYDASIEPPDGVEPIVLDGAGETMFWIAEHRALVPGDRLLGDRPPGLRMCPPSWLRYLGGYTHDDLREALRRRLLVLPIELVLTSHGEPVIGNGREAVERALAA